jgi:hypothetical protein
MPTIDAATWSAVAASFAAISSLMIMLIQRRNLLESVRPELVLTGWDRESRGQGDSARDVITVKTIKNVGRGPALHVHMSCFNNAEGRPTAMGSTVHDPIIAAGESRDLNGAINLWWKNVNLDTDANKYQGIDVKVFCWDTRGIRHEVRYGLLAIKNVLPQDVGDPSAVAPGVMLGTRTTLSRPVWWLKVQSWPRRAVKRLRKWLGLT